MLYYKNMHNTKTKIFLDSGDPSETRQLLDTGIYLDGQTTNPSLIVKNPEIIDFLQNQKFTRPELFEKYHTIVMNIRELLPEGDISAEVYANSFSAVENLVSQGRIIADWFPGIFVKLPITPAGLGAAEILTKDGISVNMTLCFSQEQAAAVHSATKNKAVSAQVYVSPFIGRLDDLGVNGCDIVGNISQMYHMWHSHVGILGASIRSAYHIDYCLKQKISAFTAPAKLITQMQLPYNDEINSAHQNTLESIPYQDILELSWDQYNVMHPLTDKGLKKFSDDWDQICTI